ncbi:MAG TPA: hypothetical protein VK811_06380 [Candidatus Acidoferrum sp.]|nr:hypothetical protein [Candidatus Acidoferrum sp.]
MPAVLAALLSPPAMRTVAAAEPQKAVITFSGLWNGINPYTNFAVLHRPLPSSYQPLMEAEPFTKPVDGGNFGIRIGWDNAKCSNHGLNQNVKDHTRDAVPTNDPSIREFGGGIMFAEGPCTMTFSQPIEIPSLFWTFYEPATRPVLKNGTIAVFRNVADTTPLKSVEVPYHDARGYVWRQLTAFAGLKISKIVFDPRDQDTGLNIDDITVMVNDHH